MFKFAAGYRTYIVGAMMIVVSGLFYQGYISEGLFKTLEGILLGGGIAALRAGIASTKQ